jgi:SAM-dependent methyltransferase
MTTLDDTDRRRHRDTSYGQDGASFVDRLRTALVGRSIRRSLPGKSDLVALDLGCGYHATYLRAIRPRLARGVGVDVSVSTECDTIPRLEFLRGTVDATLPSLPADEFDLVLLISVLEHLIDPLSALTHCRRVLKPEGLLMLNVPTWPAKPVLEFSAFRLGTSPPLEMDDHRMYYSKRDLWPLLVKAGFKPSRIKLHYQRLGMVLFGLVHKSNLPEAREQG